MDHGKCIKGVNVPPENIQCPENCLECEINVENVVIYIFYHIKLS